MEKLWTTAEVARYLAISEADVAQLVRDGKLTGYKLGGQFLRFRPDQVKPLKPLVEPRPSDALLAPVERSRWQERVQDFLYFYDLYLVSGLLLAGLLLYLVSSG